MVGPMTNSLVGDYLPREKRAGAISWMMTGMAGIGILGRFIINYLNGIGGWRIAFLGYAVPVALLALVMIFFWIPQSNEETASSSSGEGLMSGYKRVYGNKSALSCLFGMAISQTDCNTILLGIIILLLALILDSCLIFQWD